jgi:outer membrane biogenesis lipoprotein LolB
MRWLSLLLLLLLLGCTRTVPMVPEEEPTPPDPRQLWQEEIDTPSFHRVYQRFFEPWWL